MCVCRGEAGEGGGVAGRMRLWEAEQYQRILHFALMTGMRGLGIDSPCGSKWAHASGQLFQHQLRPQVALKPEEY